LVREYGAAEASEIVTLVNVAVVLAALGLSILYPGGARASVDREAVTSPRPNRASDRLATAAFLAGFQTMALQVVWNRTLICVVENNTTSFSLILASVLVGSSLGAALYVAFGSRGDRTSTDSRLRLFFAVEVLLCLFVVGSLPL